MGLADSINTKARETPTGGKKEVCIMARPKPTELTVEQNKFVRMEANGYTTPEIIMELWGKTPDDPTYHNLECKLSRWRKHPKYVETWKDEISSVSIKLMNKGLGKILRQMDASEPWLANKAANDGVNFARSRIFVDEERAINVQITGLPDIGSPNEDG